MKQRRIRKSFALIAAAGLFVAACGGDDDDSAEPAEETAEATAEETAEEPAEETAEEPAEETAEEPAEETADEPAEETADEGGGEEAEGDVDTEIEEVAVEAVYGGELILGLEAETEGLRPWDDSGNANYYAISNTIYDKLFETTADGTTEGYLAIDITPNDDLTVWVMNLREGVVFHDGTPLTAQTIADMFPIQQAGARSSSQAAAAGLESVEATGDLEVTYTLAAPNVAFPTFLERTTLGHVFEPTAAAADPESFNTNPIGTGPFILESRDLDNETRVVRNENYWRTDADGNPLPYLDSISFRPIPDEGARLDSLVSGTINAMISLRGGTIRDARAASDGLTLIEAQGSQAGGGYYNALLPPYDDKRVRVGLTHMNNQEAVIEALGSGGISLGGTQQFSPDSPWYSEATAALYPQFDFEQGVALIQEYIDDPERSDGKAPGENIDVELSCPPDPTLIAAMQVIEQVWVGSGLVNVELTQSDQATHVDTAFNSEHRAHCWRMGADLDPALWVPPTVGPPNAEIAAEFGYDESAVSSLNYPDWFDQETYEAALAASQTTDFDERKALYEQVFSKLNEEGVFWYSGHTPMMAATADNVFGFNGWTLPEGQLGVGILPDANVRLTEVFITE